MFQAVFCPKNTFDHRKSVKEGFFKHPYNLRYVVSRCIEPLLCFKVVLWFSTDTFGLCKVVCCCFKRFLWVCFRFCVVH